MSDAFDRFVASGLLTMIARARDWAMTITYPHDFEVFLNPVDADGVLGADVLGMQVRQSIGVPVGECLIFDRGRRVYIREGETPWATRR